MNDKEFVEQWKKEFNERLDNMTCNICGSKKHLWGDHTERRLMAERLEEERQMANDQWGISDPDQIIRGSVRDVTDEYKESYMDFRPGKKGSKDVVSYTEQQMIEMRDVEHARRLAREQRKALEESYENARRVEVIEENTKDLLKAKVVENVAIGFAALAIIAAMIGIFFGFDNVLHLSIPLGAGSIGAAGYKASIGDRINDRRKQLKKEGYF